MLRCRAMRNLRRHVSGLSVLASNHLRQRRTERPPRGREIRRSAKSSSPPLRRFTPPCFSRPRRRQRSVLWNSSPPRSTTTTCKAYLNSTRHFTELCDVRGARPSRRRAGLSCRRLRQLRAGKVYVNVIFLDPCRCRSTRSLDESAEIIVHRFVHFGPAALPLRRQSCSQQWQPRYAFHP